MGLSAWGDTGLSGKGCCTTSFESTRPRRMLYAEMPSAEGRVYRNEGANAAWHADGYDKSKPYI